MLGLKIITLLLPTGQTVHKLQSKCTKELQQEFSIDLLRNLPVTYFFSNVQISLTFHLASPHGPNATSITSKHWRSYKGFILGAGDKDFRCLINDDKCRQTFEDKEYIYDHVYIQCVSIGLLTWNYNLGVCDIIHMLSDSVFGPGWRSSLFGWFELDVRVDHILWVMWESEWVWENAGWRRLWCIIISSFLPQQLHNLKRIWIKVINLLSWPPLLQ